MSRYHVFFVSADTDTFQFSKVPIPILTYTFNFSIGPIPILSVNFFNDTDTITDTFKCYFLPILMPILTDTDTDYKICLQIKSTTNQALFK
jgi:hypothetical protein